MEVVWKEGFGVFIFLETDGCRGGGYLFVSPETWCYMVD